MPESPPVTPLRDALRLAQELASRLNGSSDDLLAERQREVAAENSAIDSFVSSERVAGPGDS